MRNTRFFFFKLHNFSIMLYRARYWWETVQLSPNSTRPYSRSTRIQNIVLTCTLVDSYPKYYTQVISHLSQLVYPSHLVLKSTHTRNIVPKSTCTKFDKVRQINIRPQLKSKTSSKRSKTCNEDGQDTFQKDMTTLDQETNRRATDKWKHKQRKTEGKMERQTPSFATLWTRIARIRR